MENSQSFQPKIINDPLYGFISLSSPLICDLIAHPYFQRLRHISQTGLSYLVYPGATHTRFNHSLGCLHLMSKALDTLSNKGIPLSDQEKEAACIAILLHDIGHGPFSHALEKFFIAIPHEKISLLMMHELNELFQGKLSLAISIFDRTYPRKFLSQLITSQLDVDRLDYLARDSFYTGVVEGNIGVDRIISMMNVVDNEIVIEEKGIYSVEKFIIARLFMYWQVYLHKTSLGAERMLYNILLRAKELLIQGINIFTTPEILHVMQYTTDSWCNDSAAAFTTLTDHDIITCVKQWCKSEDSLLAQLSDNFINRRLYKLFPLESLSKGNIDPVLEHLSLSKSQLPTPYFSDFITLSHLAYNPDYPIFLLTKNWKKIRLEDKSTQLDFRSLSKPIKKHYLCYIAH